MPRLATMDEPPVSRSGQSWKQQAVAKNFLRMRGGLPLEVAQFDVVRRLLSDLKEVNQFVDLGCGNGTMAAAVLDVFPSAHAVLVDHSEAMLTEARVRFDGVRNVDIVSSDLANSAWMSQVPQSVDLVVSGYAIHHLEDSRKLTLFQEIFAGLGGGGCFLNIEHVASTSPRWAKMHDRLMIDSLVDYRGAVEGVDPDRVQADYLSRADQHDNILVRLEDQLAWLRRVGFEEVDCYFKIFELAIYGGIRPR